MKSNKFFGNQNYLSLILALLVLVLLVGQLFKRCSTDKTIYAVNNHKWDKLFLILDQIEKNYVDTIDYAKLVEKIIPGVMENLDPHSLYLPPVELQEADESLQGNFSGIGIQFNVPNDTAIVINVIPGGPSEKAGLLSGDRIILVDKDTVAGVKINQDSLVKKMRGPLGSAVHIGIKRDNLAELLSFSIKRDKIPVKSIDAAIMVNDTLGYIRLSKFTKTSYKEFVEAMDKLKKQGVKGLIFDLRDNTGGYLDQALLLSNEFLSKGELIVYMEGLHRERQEFFADGRGKWKSIPLYILINENSASSSEIFAGAIQDNDRGSVFGRRSYGKGLVQEPIYFSDNSGIRLTVARFYTPTGRSIQKPYSEDYQYDIYERYKHGEMTVADSIRKVDSLMFTTKGGKIVYGGGGIIPDVFVPIDTVGVTDFLIAVNRKSLLMKYSNVLADKYRKELRGVKSLDQLDKLLNSMDIPDKFLLYAKENGVVPKKGEWEESKDILVTQLYGLVGRYSPLDDDAFYPYILKIDNVIDKVKNQNK